MDIDTHIVLRRSILNQTMVFLLCAVNFEALQVVHGKCVRASPGMIGRALWGSGVGCHQYS
jgi:hypothetical protein